MTEEPNRAKLDRFFQAFGAADTDTIHALLHPEFEIQEADGLPYAGIYRGHAGWDALIASVLAAWSEVEIEPQYILGEADGDRFAAMQVMRGRSRSGERFETTVFELWVFRDGLVREVRPYYFDACHLARIGQAEPAAARG